MGKTGESVGNIYIQRIVALFTFFHAHFITHHSFIYTMYRTLYTIRTEHYTLHVAMTRVATAEDSRRQRVEIQGPQTPGTPRQANLPPPPHHPRMATIWQI